MANLFRIDGDVLTPIEAASLPQENLIQNWIEERPELLGRNLLIIGREISFPDVGRLDLLAIDTRGNLTILEFKRGRTPRDVIAQILDYASQVAKLNTKQIHACANEYLEKKTGRTLPVEFEARFKAPLPETLNQSHEMLIVASEFDPSSDRIVRYLTEERGVAINAAFFNVFEKEGQRFLTSDWLLDQDAIEERTQPNYRIPLNQLLESQQAKAAMPIIQVCRQLSNVAEERAEASFGGSFRYWFQNRMVFGVNVSGGRRRPPEGELDVWLSPARLADLTGGPESEIRHTLERQFTAETGTRKDLVIRLKTASEATTLIELLRGWLTTASQNSTDD